MRWDEICENSISTISHAKKCPLIFSWYKGYGKVTSTRYSDVEFETFNTRLDSDFLKDKCNFLAEYSTFPTANSVSGAF